MAETRMEKYKALRESAKSKRKVVIKQSDVQTKDSSLTLTNSLATKEVFGELNENPVIETNGSYKKRLIIKRVVIASICVVVLAVLVFLGIKAFGGK